MNDLELVGQFKNIVVVLSILAALGFGTRQGVQVLKVIFSKIGLNWIKDEVSFLVAVVASGILVYGFDLNIVDSFPSLDFPPELGQLLTMFAQSFAANLIHDKMVGKV